VGGSEGTPNDLVLSESTSHVEQATESTKTSCTKNINLTKPVIQGVGERGVGWGEVTRHKDRRTEVLATDSGVWHLEPLGSGLCPPHGIFTTSRQADRVPSSGEGKPVPVGFEVSTAVTMKNSVFCDIKTQSVLHRRHITSPLQSPADGSHAALPMVISKFSSNAARHRPPPPPPRNTK
jgi:hypothetical protein